MRIEMNETTEYARARRAAQPAITHDTERGTVLGSVLLTTSYR